jgi:uncharacterized membrane protein
MFQFLFKYPTSVFSKGQFVLLAPWPVWVLAAAILAGALLLAWHVRRHSAGMPGLRPVAIWLLQTALVALVLFLLWHPALSVATLRPQQNVVAVLVDDSRSMSVQEDGSTRLTQARTLLDGGLLAGLGQKFQVRLYRFGADAERIPKTQALAGNSPASHIAASLSRVLADTATLPLGAIVLLSDGADNAGGIDLDEISEIRRRQVPVHTIGFGKEKPVKDIEVVDVSIAPRALADSRLSAQVTVRQYGLAQQRARLSVRDSGKVLASQEITLKPDGIAQTEPLVFNAGAAGPRNLQYFVEPLPVEENRENNGVTRLLNVESRKPRILYIEGEPKWEFKFIRRAAEEDKNLELVTMLRTTQNKIYRQGIANPHELEDGFPAKAEDLFAYQGLIVGGVEAGYFTSAQQELIREFANRRGGGVLFLAGRSGLSDGGYPQSGLAEMLPVRLPDSRSTFHRGTVAFDLTTAGRDNVICRLEESAERNTERWKKMPPLADYQEIGEAKPGATVLIDVDAPGRRPSPLLAIQNYGRGRTAVFATSGSWRWQMLQDVRDRTHEIFWTQLLRWLVSGSPGPVSGTAPKGLVADEGKVQLRAEVRDASYRAVPGARVEARIVGPEGGSGHVDLTPQPLEEGVYTGEWNADKPGSYVAEIVANQEQKELGRDVVMFRREDGVAENFHRNQNRELLEKLADQTGGRYFTARSAGQLTRDISYSEAGISTRETRDLWDMPVVFLVALLLRASEWVLRRRWGAV